MNGENICKTIIQKVKPNMATFFIQNQNPYGPKVSEKNYLIWQPLGSTKSQNDFFA
jgi:hypothetical protein